MLSKYKYFLLDVVLTFGLISNIALAQVGGKKLPTIGQPCPEFTLTNVDYFKSNKVALSDLEGKWAILDFWGTWCKACIAGFPKINELQEVFKDRIHFILVGRNDLRTGQDIKPLYEKLRKRYNLKLTSAYDSLLFQQFDIKLVPRFIIIDDKGTVRAITASSSISKEILQDLLDNKNPKMWDKSKRKIYDSTDLFKPLLVGNNGGRDNDFLYRSILSRWTHEMEQIVPQNMDILLPNGFYQGTGMPVKWLYNLAYTGFPDWRFGDPHYGKFFMEPILTIKDSTPFDFDFSIEKEIYNYSVIVPKEKATRQYLQQIMQSDLKNYFGYDVTVESREFPYWALVIISEKKIQTLKAKDTTVSKYSYKMGTSLCINCPLKSVLRNIAAKNPKKILIDETGITENVDLVLDAFLMDFEDVKKELNRNGLDLVQKTKQMSVLVIRDP